MNRVGEIKGIARNENSGDPYWVVSFRDVPQGRMMIGIVYDGLRPFPAVVRLEDFIGQHAFNPALENGNEFEEELVEAIRAWQAATPMQRTTWGQVKGNWKGERT
jgi:hypothetical protein